MNLLLELRRLDDLVKSRLRFLDNIRDEATRRWYFELMIKPYWRLAEAVRQRLED